MSNSSKSAELTRALAFEVEDVHLYIGVSVDFEGLGPVVALRYFVHRDTYSVFDQAMKRHRVDGVAFRAAARAEHPDIKRPGPGTNFLGARANQKRPGTVNTANDLQRWRSVRVPPDAKKSWEPSPGD